MFHLAHKTWNLWHPRVAVSAGSMLQFFLAMLGFFRKHNYSQPRKLMTWLCFTAAELISYAPIVFPFVAQSATDHQLVSLWAAFSILLLGGTDSITALSLEDNQLWRRGAVKLIVKGIMYAIVILQCFLEGMYDIFELIIILIVLCGLYTCGERILAHKWGSLDELNRLLTGQGQRPIEQDFASIRDELLVSERSGHPSIVLRIDQSSRQNTNSTSGSLNAQQYEIQMLVTSDAFYRKYLRGLYIEMRYSLKAREDCRSHFVDMPSNEIFQIANNCRLMMHEEIHSKAHLSQTIWGLISRLAILLVMFGSSIFFIDFPNEHSLPRADVVVTFLLFFLEIATRLLSLYFLIFSRQKVVQVVKSGSSAWGWIVNFTLKFCLPKDPKLLIGQIDLFDCLYFRQPSLFKRIMDFIFSEEGYKNFILARHTPLDQDIQHFVCKGLKKKSKDAEEIKNYLRFTKSRGIWTLNKYPNLEWSVTMNFSESALIWTIATTLVYYDSQSSGLSKNLEIAKCLSDYFLHLLEIKPKVFSSTAPNLVQIATDALKELERFLLDREPNMSDRGKASELLLCQNTDYDCRELMGDGYQFVLWYGCKLARELLSLESPEREVVLCDIWLEMLSYAAIHCRGDHHAELLAEGGELFNLIWEINFLLGLSEHYISTSSSVFSSTISTKREV